jgi:DTW domain-containing protein YfiP
LILQHPNEQKKHYSTAKLVAQGITNCRIVRGVEFEPGVIEKAIEGQEPYLLFPSPGAVSCETVALKPNSTVIVIDGTWSEAKKIVFRNPILRTLPTISFSQPLRSNYRIRKQPRDHCLSTIESIAHLLKLNAAGQGKLDSVQQYESLLLGFEKMVDIQVKYFPRFSGVSSGRRKIRGRKAKVA